MHLLRLSPGHGESSVILQEHVGEIPHYAILSHRWGPPSEEITYEDLIKNDSSILSKKKKGYQKIKMCCEQASEYGIQYCWVDTCCINKSSSAELSEAINSMYAWYRDAQLCIAYLNDVPSDESPCDKNSAFRRSVWFTRGWTLQELIAPVEILFFAEDWDHRSLGSRSSLADIISEITRISGDIMRDRNKLELASIAQKMSWAAGRQTTRIEDEAYSLIGIFDVSMPIIYGEGKRAFLRLQEEIMLRTTDHTLFAWDGTLEDVETYGMLAPSPHSFTRSADYVPVEFNKFSALFENSSGMLLQPSYSMTNFGLNISLPAVPLFARHEQYLLVCLACMSLSEEGIIILFLKRRAGRPEGHFMRTCLNSQAITRTSHPRDIGSYHKPESLWISGLGKQPRPTRNPTKLGKINKLIVQYRENLGEDEIRWMNEHIYPRKRWESLKADIGDDYRRIVLKEGDYMVVPSQKGCTSKDSSWVVAAFGLQDGEAWYHFQGPFPADGIGGAKLAQEEYHKYDILRGGRYWLEDSPLNYYKDETSLRAQYFCRYIISTWTWIQHIDGGEEEEVVVTLM